MAKYNEYFDYLIFNIIHISIYYNNIIISKKGEIP
jgi:hypothetical protein